MQYDKFGQAFSTSDELCSLLYTNPTVNIQQFKLQDPEEFNASVKQLHADLPILEQYVPSDQSIDEFEIGRAHV